VRRFRLTLVLWGAALLVSLAVGTATAGQVGEVEAPPSESIYHNGGGGGSLGTVTFQIGHGCHFWGLPRPWLYGEARHWDPSGVLHTRSFMHQSGYEWAHFGWQLVGVSRGDARITLGLPPCNACSTGLVTYTVNPGVNPAIEMTMYR
jgi:hypothetical protein